MSVMEPISSQMCQLALAQRIAMTKASDTELPAASQLPTAAVGVTMHDKNLSDVGETHSTPTEGK